ncbi:MAG: radical SAM protein [Candidatus Omnitrophota bacterium]
MGRELKEMVIERPPFIFAKPWHRHFPPMIVVSITNVCNLRCIHCYYSKFSKLTNYHKSVLPWGIWEKICKEAGQWPGVIMNFGTDGEPFLHPRFIDMLRFARKCNISPVNVTTNGTVGKFNRAIIEESLVDVINISLDAYTAETYKKIRGGDFERVIGNVNNLIGLRNLVNSPIKIQVNIIDQPAARDELKNFKKHWGKIVDNVLVRDYYDATSVLGETGPDITGRQKKFKPIQRWPCQQLWRRFNISDDGIVRFCVDDWFNKTKIGDLRTQSISEIWTSKEYDRLRHIHIKGQFHRIPYCFKCTEWQGMRWDYDYFTAIKKMLGNDFLKGE